MSFKKYASDTGRGCSLPLTWGCNHVRDGERLGAHSRDAFNPLLLLGIRVNDVGWICLSLTYITSTVLNILIYFLLGKARENIQLLLLYCELSDCNLLMSMCSITSILFHFLRRISLQFSVTIYWLTSTGVVSDNWYIVLTEGMN